MIEAAETTAPLGSVTLPEIAPVKTTFCAANEMQEANKTQDTNVRRARGILTIAAMNDLCVKNKRWESIVAPLRPAGGCIELPAGELEGWLLSVSVPVKRSGLARLTNAAA